MISSRNITPILFVALFSLCFSQIRYLNPVFDQVDIYEDVVYGNAPDLPFIFWVESNTYDIDLDVDIYMPAGDSLSSRPAIIFLHSGAFFAGNNNADDMTQLSIESAKRGYVSFNANYRLGLNILSTYSGERAVYRGVQDASALIRFIKENSDMYGIDTDNIFIWGSSAGAFIGLHLAYLDDSERPESSFGSEDDPDLGCLDCEGNNFIHDSRPNAIVSCWGAMGDVSWVSDNDTTPAILFHGTLDPIVPFNSGFPFTFNIALPLVDGSNVIREYLNYMDVQNEFYPAIDEFHEYWGTLNGNWFGGPNEYWDIILNHSYQFLYNQISANLIGDLNLDGVVNVVDVIVCVNIVLSGSFDAIADLDGNNINNILDIINLVNIIIN